MIITLATRLSHDASNLPYGCVVSTLTDDVSWPYAVTEVELVFLPELRGVAVRKVFLLSERRAPSTKVPPKFITVDCLTPLAERLNRS